MKVVEAGLNQKVGLLELGEKTYASLNDETHVVDFTVRVWFKVVEAHPIVQTGNLIILYLK